MRLWPGHRRLARAASLLAAGALDDPALRARVEEHASGCPACAEQLRETAALVALLRRDPLRGAEPAIPAQALRTRVLARLDAPTQPRPGRAGVRWAFGTAAALAAAVLGVVALRGTVPSTPVAPATVAPTPAVAETADTGEEFVRRLEQNVAREQAARYLDDAGDVLVNVAAQAQPCPKGDERVDVAAEARRSRELLARRRLLDVDGAAVATARPVLDDVELLLREVASLESCARKRDLDRVHRQIERSRLLLKIDLTARELAG